MSVALTTAREVLAEAQCSPQCLVSVAPGHRCRCVCHGANHGRLADAELTEAGDRDE